MRAEAHETLRPSPFPFIVGVGRSGTTLLRAILDTHPSIAIPGESHFIPAMATRRRRYETAKGLRSGRFLEDVDRYHWFRRWELPVERVVESLRREPPLTLSDAIRRLFEVYAAERGKTRYGDKTPAYINHIPTLAGLFPEARFVHLMRDGRDVALSRLDHPTMSRTLPELAILWRRGVEKGRRAGRRLGPRRYLEIRYEDLVSTPEEVTRLVCRFLELPFDPVVLRYHERASEIIKPIPHPESHSRVHLPPTKGLRQWRSQMSREEIILFDSLAGELLEDLGYARAGYQPSLRESLAARRRRLIFEVHRVMRAARKRFRPTSPQVGVGD
jgi:hypothetical protein